VDPRELDTCFPEFRPFLGNCRYADCKHRSEPGCKVRAAIEEGVIAADRWQSYLVLLDELETAPAAWE
jgi:ribosome biogenesis GTPase